MSWLWKRREYREAISCDRHFIILQVLIVRTIINITILAIYSELAPLVVNSVSTRVILVLVVVVLPTAVYHCNSIVIASVSSTNVSNLSTTRSSDDTETSEWTVITSVSRYILSVERIDEVAVHTDTVNCYLLRSCNDTWLALSTTEVTLSPSLTVNKVVATRVEKGNIILHCTILVCLVSDGTPDVWSRIEVHDVTVDVMDTV